MAGNAKFNALHPRDRFGRFTKSRTVRASAKDKTAAKAVADGFEPSKKPSGSGREAYLQKIAGADAGRDLAGLPEVNKALRAGDESAPGIADLDRSLVALPDDLLLSRSVPASAFGSTDPMDLQGMKVRDAGFAAAQVGTVPATQGAVRMHIAASAGTKAAVNPATGEVVLDRDTEMVVAKVEQSPAGGHDMYLTVLPKAGAKTSPTVQPKQGKTAPASTDKPAKPDTPEGGDQVRADLMKLKVSALQAQMRERGLKPGRKRKSELVDALVADEMGHDGTTEKPAANRRETNAPKPTPEPTPAAPSTASPLIGSAALAAAPKGLHRDDRGLDDFHRRGLVEYQDGTGVGYKGINRRLRGESQPNGKVNEFVAGIDEAMAASPLSHDVVSYRGVSSANRIFGKDRAAGDLTGMQWQEDAYVSTSTQQSTVDAFTGPAGLQMRIVSPAGTRAVDLSDPDDPSEEELLLDRGHTFEVVTDHGVDPDGIRHIDVRALPKKATPARDAAAPTTSRDVVPRQDGASTEEPALPVESRVRDAASTVSTLISAGVSRQTVSTALQDVLDANDLKGDETPELKKLTDLVHGPHGQIRRAVEQALADQGRPQAIDEYVNLKDVRDRLPAGLDRAKVDKALIDIAARDGHVVPESNQKTLTPEQRAAAVSIGNQDNHLIALDGGDRKDVADAAKAASGDRKTQQPTPATKAPEPGSPSPKPVSGTPSKTPIAPNTWGEQVKSPDDIHFHDDGEIGTAIKTMGDDRLMDIDGQPLANVLGRIATDAVLGRITAQEQVNELQALLDRLPSGSPARKALAATVERLDAPQAPAPKVPDGIPGPLKDLVAALHANPLVRNEPDRELQPLLDLVADYAAGKAGGPRMIREVQKLSNRRHESVEGKMDIDRAVSTAVAGLEALVKANGPRSLYAKRGGAR